MNGYLVKNVLVIFLYFTYDFFFTCLIRELVLSEKMLLLFFIISHIIFFTCFIITQITSFSELIPFYIVFVHFCFSG